MHPVQYSFRLPLAGNDRSAFFSELTGGRVTGGLIENGRAFGIAAKDGGKLQTFMPRAPKEPRPGGVRRLPKPPEPIEK